MNSICVFGGSSRGRDGDYYRPAFELGQAIAERGFQLVYGGSAVGLMGGVARGALSMGGRVVGVIPRAIHERVEPLEGIVLEVCEDMHQRKARMYALSDGFIAMPGGIGTMEELMEVLTWQQLGYHRKAVAVYNVLKFYDPMLKFLDSMVEKGFLKGPHRDSLIVSGSDKELIGALTEFSYQETSKW